ncbi:MAG: tetratricopeptide repeat protein [Candidatus Omnitrophota bacterium]
MIRKRIQNYGILFVMIACGIWLTDYSYAQEQNIAESFGLYSRGIEYYHQGKLYEAKETLEQAVKLDPRNDEAQGYLDLVNAEIYMREKGRLDTYKEMAEIKRESDPRLQPQIEPGSEPELEPEPEPEETEPGYPEDASEEEEGFYEPEAKKSTGEIRGEYKMSFGVRGDDVIWKEANGDYNERNFRMIDHNFGKTNTFDTRVYDRFKVVFDTNKQGEGLNFHSNITVDPWSFRGRTDKITIWDATGTDSTEVELKYWSNTRSTINEIIPTLIQGDAISLPEIKVIDGKTTATTVTDTFGQTYIIPETDIHETFQPVRELWFDYSNDDTKLRIFPFGLEDQAFSSDDPMGLSNHHIYWEPSPWLDDWEPGNYNSDSIPTASFTPGEWSDDLSFFTRDSELQRLTALRGASFQGNLSDTTGISATIATPQTLWQEYDNVTALPAAMRMKTQMTDNLMIGLIGTSRIGFDEGSADSYNNVAGIDASYDIGPGTNIVAQVSASKSEYDRISSFKSEKRGNAGHAALKKESGVGNMKIAFTHMDEAFDPGLANYRETRRDQSWGRHLHFKKPLEYNMWGGGSMTYDDIEPFRIGDGVDTGRDVINFRLDKKDAFEEKMDNLIAYRYVRNTDNKYIEGVVREENTFRINPEWTSKLLFLYHDMPKTKGGIDPFLYDSDTGEYLVNAAIEDGKDPSLSTYSAGLEYAPEEWISFFGIYENTNDSTLATGDHPRGLLNNTSFSNVTRDGKTYKEELPFLYNQGFFDLPPYERFNIYRAGISLKPAPGLGIDLDFTKNDFKFAQGIDDNLNHFGTSLRYEFNPKLTGFLKYTFSKAYNVYRLNTSGDLKYQSHHNVFAEFDYTVSEYGLLVIQFGEGSVLSPIWGATASPFGDFYPTLDTQHIIRVYYNGRF